MQIFLELAPEELVFSDSPKLPVGCNKLSIFQGGLVSVLTIYRGKVLY